MPTRSLSPRWLRADEASSFALAALCFGLLAGAALAARAAGVGLFVESWGAQNVPLLYLGSAAFVMTSAGVLVWLMARRRVEWLLWRIIAAVGMASLLLRALLPVLPEAMSVAAFLLADLIAQLLIALFWALAGRLYDPRQSRRLLGPLGASGTLACILVGSAVAPLASRAGTENLILGVGLLLFAAAICARPLAGHIDQDYLPGALQRPGFAESLRVLGRHPLALSLAGLVVLATASLLLVDYVFVALLEATRSGDQYAAFYGTLYARANLGALVIQLLLASALLRMGGVQLGLAVLPGSLLLFVTLGLVTGDFLWIAVAKAHEPLFFFTLHAMAMQMLYHGVPEEIRDRVRAAADGIVRPATVLVIGATLLIFGARGHWRLVLALTLPLLIIWLWSTRLNRRRYLKALIDSLDSRRLERQGIPLGAETIDTLRARWSVATPEERGYLVALVEELDVTELAAEWIDGGDVPPGPLLARLLRVLEGEDDLVDIDRVVDWSRDQESEVGVAAARLILQLPKLSLAEDPDEAAQETARRIERLPPVVVGLRELRRRPADEAQPTVVHWFEEISPEDQRLVVACLDLVPGAERRALAHHLVAGSDLALKRQGLRAAAQARDPADAPWILQGLRTPELMADAVEGLRRLGPETVNATLEAHPELDLGLGEGLLLGLVADWQDSDFLPFLERRVEQGDHRRTAAEALASVLRAHPQQRTRRRCVAKGLGILTEAELAFRLLGRAARLPGSQFLQRGLAAECRDRLETALWLFEADRRTGLDMGRVSDRLLGANQRYRGRALETLENSLDLSARTALQRLFEPAASEDPHQIDGDLSRAVRSREFEWSTRGAALMQLRSRSPQEFERLRVELREAVHTPETIRELVEAPTGGMRPVAPLDTDADAPASGRKQTMITYERAARLSEIDLFTSLRPSALALLAERATERVLPAGGTLFEQGAEGRSMYLIVSGEVEILRDERRLATLGAGEHVGEMSLLDDETRSATVRATEDALLLRIGRRDFHALVTSHSDAALAVMRSLSQRLRQASDG